MRCFGNFCREVRQERQEKIKTSRSLRFDFSGFATDYRLKGLFYRIALKNSSQPRRFCAMLSYRQPGLAMPTKGRRYVWLRLAALWSCLIVILNELYYTIM